MSTFSNATCSCQGAFQLSGLHTLLLSGRIASCFQVGVQGRLLSGVTLIQEFSYKHGAR